METTSAAAVHSHADQVAPFFNGVSAGNNNNSSSHVRALSPDDVSQARTTRTTTNICQPSHNHLLMDNGEEGRDLTNSSSYLTLKETSLAILEHMALDTTVVSAQQTHNSQLNSPQYAQLEQVVEPLDPARIAEAQEFSEPVDPENESLESLSTSSAALMASSELLGSDPLLGAVCYSPTSQATRKYPSTNASSIDTSLRRRREQRRARSNSKTRSNSSSSMHSNISGDSISGTVLVSYSMDAPITSHTNEDTLCGGNNSQLSPLGDESYGTMHQRRKYSEGAQEGEMTSAPLSTRAHSRRSTIGNNNSNNTNNNNNNNTSVPQSFQTWRFPSLGCDGSADSSRLRHRRGGCLAFTSEKGDTPPPVRLAAKQFGSPDAFLLQEEEEQEKSQKTPPSPPTSPLLVCADAAATHTNSNAATTNHHSSETPWQHGSISPGESGYSDYQRLFDMVYAAHEQCKQQKQQQQQQHHQHQPSPLHHLKDFSPCQTTRSYSSRSSQPKSMSASIGCARPSGYYSFGQRASQPHPNRLSVCNTPQFLGSTSALSGALAQSIVSMPNISFMRNRSMDSDLVRRIEQRPLLQTTVFLRHNMKKLNEHQHMDRLVLPSGVLSPPSLTPPAADEVYVADALSCASDRNVSPDGTGTSRYCRALTSYTHFTRHVHPIDGFEREVDSENNDLVVFVGMRLMGWLEVVSLLGRGSFGQVFLCKDLRICDGHFVHPSDIAAEDYAYWNCSHAYLPYGDTDVVPMHAPLVAVKVVKSVPLLEQQSVLEAEMLVMVGAQTCPGVNDSHETAASSFPSACSDPPPADPRCSHVAKVLADGISYGHHCIVMERYGANLYEYIRSNDHKGVPMYQIQSIGRQLLSALTLLHEECHIVHADIKPENMLLTTDSCRSWMKNTLQLEEEECEAGSNGKKSCKDPAGSLIALQHTPAMRALPVNGAQELVRSESFRQMPPLDASCAPVCPTPRRVHALSQHRPTAAGSSGTTTSSSSAAVNATATISSSSHYYDANANRSSTNHTHHNNSTNSSQLAKGSTGGGRCDMSTVSHATAATATTSVSSSGSVLPQLRIKLIDFSSSCYDAGPFYPYIQSRYYRAPEVLIEAGYGSPIDLWSTGCLLSELLLGMPLLPGFNDWHQLDLIEEMVGPLPPGLLAKGTATDCYYERSADNNKLSDTNNNNSSGVGEEGLQHDDSFKLMSKAAVHEKHKELTHEEYDRYFKYTTLQELVRYCVFTPEEVRMGNGLPPYQGSEMSNNNNNNNTNSNTNDVSKDDADSTEKSWQSTRTELLRQRFQLFNLLSNLLKPDPSERLTAAQALAHPFFTSSPSYMTLFGLQ